MNANHLLPALLFSVLLPAGPQEGPPDPRGRLEPALARLRSTDAATFQQAWQELETLREERYPDLFAAWQAEPEGRGKEALARLLLLPELGAATAVFRGTLGGLEHVQGGVVDYHWLATTVTDGALLRADADSRTRWGEGGSVHFLRGTSQDWWLADLLQRDLERVQGPRLWILRARRLDYGYSDTARTSVEVMEYTTLPAAATDAVSGWLAEQG